LEKLAKIKIVIGNSRLDKKNFQMVQIKRIVNEVDAAELPAIKV
jgi:hypothetical protein